MTEIADILLRMIVDSRGNPTVEAEKGIPQALPIVSSFHKASNIHYI